MTQQKLLVGLNLQFFGGKTLFELKQAMATIGEQLAKTEEELSAKAMNPSASLADIQAIQQSKTDLQARFDVLKVQHDEMEKAQAVKFQAQNLIKSDDPQASKTAAKAALIRAAIRQQPMPEDVKAVLGDNTSPATGGEKFLPKTVSDEIITEPLVKNPLRDIVTVTNITNLEVPKLSFTLDDDDFITDTATAKELEEEGDVVTFTRKKFKVFAGLSETVLHGSDANLVAHIENALRSGLAAKEKKIMLTTSPKAGEEHMSFYSTANAIQTATGEDTFKAIKAALASLHEDYRANASIVMSYASYLDMIETLSNGTTNFFDASPERIFGKPIVFVDSATKPIVGDFNYSQINYDLNVIYDRDKDVKTGVELFVITAYIDHRIKLKSAFRIAEVAGQTPTP